MTSNTITNYLRAMQQFYDLTFANKCHLQRMEEERQVQLYTEAFSRFYGGSTAKPSLPDERHAALLAGGWRNVIPRTAVYHNPNLKIYTGYVHGVPFDPMSERKLFTHLTKNMGYSPRHADAFIDKVKHGQTSGHAETKSLQHLEQAVHAATLAKSAHAAGNERAKIGHFGQVAEYLEKALDAVHAETQTNPLSVGRQHQEQLAVIQDLVKGLRLK